jgi:hypothetical protein
VSVPHHTVDYIMHALPSSYISKLYRLTQLALSRRHWSHLHPFSCHLNMSVVNGSEFEISAKQLLADLVTSTASKAFPDVYNRLTLLDFLEATSHPIFHHFHAQESCEPSVAISQARDLLKKWRCELKEGDYIDKYSAIDAVSCTFFQVYTYHIVSDRRCVSPPLSMFRAGIMPKF